MPWRNAMENDRSAIEFINLQELLLLLYAPFKTAKMVFVSHRLDARRQRRGGKKILQRSFSLTKKNFKVYIVKWTFAKDSNSMTFLPCLSNLI